MTKVFVLGISVMLLWSCNNSGKNGSSQATEPQLESHIEHEHDESSEIIELNNGKRWVVNEEMKPFVLKGEELVNAYVQDGQSDYKALAEQLKDQNNQLIKSCTMNGKSHDELHKWLHPHLELVKMLENEAEETKAGELILKLKESYHEYHQYFD